MRKVRWPALGLGYVLAFSVNLAEAQVTGTVVLKDGEKHTAASRLAETRAVLTMAGILANLNHFPSDAEKEQLKKIVADKATTQHERVIAQALLNVQHKVIGEDRPKLEGVVKDKTTAGSVRRLAQVILNLNHTPSDAEKAELKKLAEGNVTPGRVRP
jgi:hypothetical protein